MEEVEIRLRLPAPLFRAAEGMARAKGESLDQLLRNTLTAALRRQARPQRAAAGSTLPDPGFLRDRLSQDFRQARSWQELQGRLMLKRYVLRDARDGPALHAHPGGDRLCDLPHIGVRYEDLIGRFGRPLPGPKRHRLAAPLSRGPDQIAAE